MCTDQASFTSSPNRSKQDFDSNNRPFHWRKHYYGLWTGILARRDGLKLRLLWWICFLQTYSLSLHKMLINGLVLCGLLVVYCNVFISCLDSHSDGTHPLQSTHWSNRRNATFLKMCFHEETSSRMPWEWVFSRFELLNELLVFHKRQVSKQRRVKINIYTHYILNFKFSCHFF